MFIEILFTVDKIWKPPKCPPTDKWIKKKRCVMGGPPRWQTSKTWRLPSIPTNTSKIHLYLKQLHNINWKLAEDHRLPKRSVNFPIMEYGKRSKEKEREREKGIMMGPVPLGRSCEGGKFSIHSDTPSLVETVGSFRASEKSAAAGVQREKYREFRTGIGTNQHPPTWDVCLHACWGSWRLGAEA